MSKQALEARVIAHCQTLSAIVANLRPDQIRNRVAYIVANAEALAELKESS